MAMATVIPIGASVGDVTATVGDYVGYLQSGTPIVGSVHHTDNDGIVRYYTNTIEGAGLWAGQGAARIGLTGEVDADDLTAILDGRHHETGERLITAQGSAGRAGLKVGEATRIVDGQPVWDFHDLTARFDVTETELSDAIETFGIDVIHEDDISYIDGFGVDTLANLFRPISEQLLDGELDDQYTVTEAAAALGLTVRRVQQLCVAYEQHSTDGHDEQTDPASMIESHRTETGEWSISRQSLVEFEREYKGHLGEEIYRGKPTDILSVPEAAKLTGLTPRYIRQRCVHHEAAIDAGNEPGEDGKDWIVGERGHGRRAPNWGIKRSELAAFMSRREPPSVRIGFEVTFTTEKSASIVGLLQQGEARDAVVDAIHKANGVLLDHLEQHASAGRAKGQRIESEGLTVASFLHSTSRNQDPMLHIHNIIANTIEDSNGDRRALDARDIYTALPMARALATAEYRYQLTKNLDIQWSQSRTGTWEISKIPDKLLAAFSSRTAEMRSLAEEIAGVDYDNVSKEEKERLADRTRKPKTEVAETDLQAHWHEVANEHGFQPSKLPKARTRPVEIDQDLSVVQLEKLHQYLASENGAAATSSMFTRGDVAAAITDWTVDKEGKLPNLAILSGETVSKLTDSFLHSPHVVALGIDATRKSANNITSSVQRYTTVAMLDLQKQITKQWADPTAQVIEPKHINNAIADANTLSDEQEQLVRSWLTSGRRFQSAIGPPGTGKTFTMQTAAKAWTDAGYNVKGLAVRGSAAQNLQSESGIKSNTIAATLFSARVNGDNPFTDKDILIVDEAGTIGDRDLGKLMDLTQKAGATLRFIGDPKQHSGVTASGMWTELTEDDHETPILTVNRRAKNDVDRTIAELSRGDSMDELLDYLSNNGRLHVHDNNRDAMVAVIKAHLASRQVGIEDPLIEKTNDVRQVINGTVQQIRMARGEVTKLTNFGFDNFGIGDNVISNKPNFELRTKQGKVLNGSLGVVTDVTNKKITVDFDMLGPIDISRKWLKDGQLDLAYAATSHAVQGRTTNASDSTLRPGASHNEAHVNLTRSRQQNRAHIVNNETHHSRFVEPTSGDLKSQIADAAKSSTKASALNCYDPDRSKTLTDKLKFEYEAIHAVEFAAKFPARPTTPHLAKQWDTAAIAYAHSTNHSRRLPDAPIQEALIDTAVALTWRQVQDHLTKTTHPDGPAIGRRPPASIANQMEADAVNGYLNPKLDVNKYSAWITAAQTNPHAIETRKLHNQAVEAPTERTHKKVRRQQLEREPASIA